LLGLRHRGGQNGGGQSTKAFNQGATREYHHHVFPNRSAAAIFRNDKSQFMLLIPDYTMFARLIRVNPVPWKTSGRPVFGGAGAGQAKNREKHSGKPHQKRTLKFRIFCLFFMALSQNRKLSKKSKKTLDRGGLWS
jgi:hypothetical protein